jgi:nucleoside-diphosphate-sugar epimerase
MKSRTVAITGAGGYVGRVITDFLSTKGYNICRFSRQGTNSVSFQLGRKNDYSALDNVGTLIHCAYDFAPRIWEEIERVNIQGSIELLNEARNRGVKRIILISSISAYEGARSYYGRAKFTTEKYFKEAGAIIVRPGMVYGKGAGGVVDAMNTFVSQHTLVPLIGNGNQIMHFCHQDDLAQLIERLLYDPAPSQGPFTAASREPSTLKEFMRLLAQRQQKKVIFIPVPSLLLRMAFGLADRLGIKTRRSGDSIININTPNPHPDFHETERLGVFFRALTLAAIDA